MITITCDTCGTEIERGQWALDNYKNHFCSNECKNAFMSKPKKILYCKHCDKEILCYPSQTKKFCSQECRNEYYKINNNKIKKTCEWCGEEFTIRADFAKGTDGRFCSRKCFCEFRKLTNHTEAICETCGKEFDCLISRLRRFCSNECRYIANRGEGNYGWKGDDFNRTYPPEFNESLKEQIRNRDDYTCQMCLSTEQDCNHKMSIHHIDWDKNISDTMNLITLCISCHRKIHTKENTTRDHFTKLAAANSEVIE